MPPNPLFQLLERRRVSPPPRAARGAVSRPPCALAGRVFGRLALSSGPADQPRPVGPDLWRGLWLHCWESERPFAHVGVDGWGRSCPTPSALSPGLDDADTNRLQTATCMSRADLGCGRALRRGARRACGWRMGTALPFPGDKHLRPTTRLHRSVCLFTQKLSGVGSRAAPLALT